MPGQIGVPLVQHTHTHTHTESHTPKVLFLQCHLGPKVALNIFSVSHAVLNADLSDFCHIILQLTPHGPKASICSVLKRLPYIKSLDAVSFILHCRPRKAATKSDSPGMKILSSFTHLHVVPNPYDFLYSA